MVVAPFWKGEGMVGGAGVVFSLRVVDRVEGVIRLS